MKLSSRSLFAGFLVASLAVAGPAAFAGPKPTTTVDLQSETMVPPTAVAEVPEEQRLADDVEARQSLSFPAELTAVAQLRGSRADVGYAEYGIPMTAAEKAEFERRGEMADMMVERLDPAARARLDFAGLYIDNPAGGKIVVLTTGDATQVQKDLAAVDSRLADDLVVRQVAITEEALKEAVRTIPDAGYFGDIPLYELGVDLPQTRLIATVPDDQVAAAQQLAVAASRSTGIPIVVEGGELPVEEACVSRESCTSPILAGVLIRQGSTTGGRCTMGFHVTTSTGDDQFITAGHCGYSGSSWWYHRGYGLLGGELATRYFAGGEDMMRVSIPDGQTTGAQYGGGAVRTATGPSVGLAICGSMGASNTVDCGTVALGYVSWIGETCGCRVYGARATGISSTGGDSGSPIRTHSGTNAVGIHDTSSGNFAIVLDALDVWNLTMR